MRVRNVARKAVWLGLLAAGVLGTGSAWAVSDGNYDDSKQGCSDDAFNSEPGTTAETGCRALVFKIYDGSGHEYFSVGIPQTPDGKPPSALIACVDMGTGTKQCARVGKGGTGLLRPQRGTPARPASGMFVYFGANDNLNNGEHDSSEQVNNGPSDGGAVQINETGRGFGAWLNALKSRDRSYLLTHPLPLADAGVGQCADGICFSAQTQRRVVYQGGDPNKSRDVANYGRARWDPSSCSGPSDRPADCGGHPLGYWNDKNGTTYAEPGIQVYEDPDPQGSPVGPYPIPAVYLGTCGLVVGGGKVRAPKSPYTNKAGQLVISTGC